MSYYHFNRQEILQKAKDRYSKEKAADYYLKKNKETIKKVKESIQKLVQRKKNKNNEYQKKKISATDSVQKRDITK